MREILQEQSGVVSRAQLLASGATPHDIRRWVRRRELARVHPGVYVDHTGPPTWEQQAWAAVLLCQAGGVDRPDMSSAALTGASALRAVEGTGRPTAPIEVVVSDGRRIDRRPGLVVTRSSPLLSSVRWHQTPPRIGYELAVLEVAARQRRVTDVVAELARALGARRTTTSRLLAELGTRPRLPRRTLIRAVLGDLTTGACSALEHGYLIHVERPHGLPAPLRQVRSRSRTAVVYRDAQYDGLVIELDGRLWHDSVEQRDADADRDLVATVAGSATVRLTWGQVFDRACWTAGQIGRLIGVTPRRCGPTCTVA